jgi:hypothetical protein
MEGFRYVSEKLNITTGIINPKGLEEPIMPLRIKNELLFEELDFSKM